MRKRLLGTVLLVAACGGGDDDGGGGGAPDGGGKADNPEASTDWTRDLLRTELEVDLTTRTGRAVIEIADAGSTGASFEIGDLQITLVRDADGDDLDFVVDGDRLDVGVPDTDAPVTIAVDYLFQLHDAFDGWDPAVGVTFLWPTFCGNLYPCHSDPADGQSFAMTVTGAGGATAIFPDEIPTDAPTYMPAVAVGDYTELELGTTTAGTAVSIWHLPGQAADAAAGGAHLVDVMDFYEETYGAYRFGDKVGTVSVDWGPGDFGGMEHHPFWHVDDGSLDNEEVNAHEAAHGWYGNGVRIACWEDFVLSEGTVTYMAARALGEQGVDVWDGYCAELGGYCDAGGETIALPDTCGEIDILTDPLWSGVPYMKGAFFLREVAGLIGEAEVDGVLADFYAAHAGGAARMDELVEALAAASPPDADAIGDAADGWLRTLSCPASAADACP
ncbi:MAG TPA: M1 family aminopeptidase [Kofleriaceae bacterium]|nr:M1 family aminopeptidase [Kofleriaceae bacterium]